jgi:glutathione S-transferase
MQLVGRVDSAATERARWTLDHHALVYRYIEYRPAVDALWLRVFARQPFGPIEPPVLRHGGHLLRESFQIAQHAEREGTKERLIPDVSAIVRWNGVSDRIIAAGHALALRRALGARLPVDLTLPSALFERARQSRELGTLGRDAAAEAVQFIALRSLLGEVRQGLGSGGGRFLVREAFSYADIAIASSLLYLRPPSPEFAPIPEATRAIFEQPVLADEFGDLFAWRDDVYSQFRRRGSARRAVPESASVG